MIALPLLRDDRIRLIDRLQALFDFYSAIDQEKRCSVQEAVRVFIGSLVRWFVSSLVPLSWEKECGHLTYQNGGLPASKKNLCYQPAGCFFKKNLPPGLSF